jgi:hypothetical protein
MRHRTLSRIANPIPLIPTDALREAVQDKRNRRPISTTKRGLIKASGKDRTSKVAFVRAVNLARVTLKAAKA